MSDAAAARRELLRPRATQPVELQVILYNNDAWEPHPSGRAVIWSSRPRRSASARTPNGCSLHASSCGPAARGAAFSHRCRRRCGSVAAARRRCCEWVHAGACACRWRVSGAQEHACACRWRVVACKCVSVACRCMQARARACGVCVHVGACRRRVWRVQVCVGACRSVQ